MNKRTLALSVLLFFVVVECWFYIFQLHALTHFSLNTFNSPSLDHFSRNIFGITHSLAERKEAIYILKWSNLISFVISVVYVFKIDDVFDNFLDLTRKKILVCCFFLGLTILVLNFILNLYWLL